MYKILCIQEEDGIRDYKVTGVQTCALPISVIINVYDAYMARSNSSGLVIDVENEFAGICAMSWCHQSQDRKSTRLNSSHLVISYAVFCLKKKKKTSDNGARMTVAGISDTAH